MTAAGRPGWAAPAGLRGRGYRGRHHLARTARWPGRAVRNVWLSYRDEPAQLWLTGLFVLLAVACVVGGVR